MLVVGVVGVVLAGFVVWLVQSGGDDDADGASTDPAASSSASADVTTPAVIDDGSAQERADRAIDNISPAVAVLDDASSAAGATVEVPVHGQAAGADESDLALVTVSAVGDGDGGTLAVGGCGPEADGAPDLSIVPGASVTKQLLVPVGAAGSICLTPSVAAGLTVELDAFLDESLVQPFPTAVRVVDSAPGGATADGNMVGIGVRPDTTTLRVPVAERFDGLADTGALVVSVTTVGAFEPGEVAVFAPEAATPSASFMTYRQTGNARATTVVPIGPSGELCVATTGRTDIVVDILGLAPAARLAPIESAGEAVCPQQTLFPDRRIVALYGTQRTARLGVLGEQDPVAAATLAEEVSAPWRAGDRPVLPAYELIATLATGTPEDRGVYNLRSSPEFVQEYLDAARRHGHYLILDLQTGQSDFLTEAKYYEEFLRQPDVGLALDPEWRTEPPDRPQGGFVGQVDAAEVNQVVDYLAELVAEEGLPEKLLIVHQFQDRMVTNREQLREAPGVAVTIHMDGFGPRDQKLASYDIVRADAPFNMGLKLFYDEDTDLLEASDVLDGMFTPIPDLITYQ